MIGVELLLWLTGGGVFVLVVSRDGSAWFYRWCDQRQAADSYDDEGFEGWGDDDWPEPV